MKTTFSKLMMGTAQIGQSYGVANQSGPPDFGAVCAMLELAAEGGINGLDTAPAYGESEELLGRALVETKLNEHFRVVTKVVPLGVDVPVAEARERVKASVERSLQRLNRDRLDAVLFHREEDGRVLDVLLEYQQAGVIESVGTSFTSPEGAWKALEAKEISAMQVPANLLDRRFSSPEFFEAAEGCLIFTRSAYLQGLLLMSDEATPAHLQIVVDIRTRLRKLAESYGMELWQLLLRGMMAKKEITSVVVGVETPDQLRANMSLLHAEALPESLIAELDALPVETLPGDLINPPRWPALAAALAAKA